MDKAYFRTKDQDYFGSRVLAALFFAGIFFITQIPPSEWTSVLTKNYLPIHMVLEFVGILVCFAIFTVGWATYQNARSTDILVLSVICFMVGCFDLGHTLSFTGMPDFITPSGPNKAIDFWLASRITGSLGFLFISLSEPRNYEFQRLRFLLMLGAIVVTYLFFWIVLYHSALLPVMFIPGQGLTPIKIVLEWFGVIVSFITGILFFRKGLKRNNYNLHWIGSASLLFGMGGYFFTLYRNFDDLYNFAGHIYKAVAFIMVYRSVFVECVSKPYQEARRLAREASEANTSKSRFLANVSHEFRTPLGVISGFSEMLSESKDLSGEELKWAETISRNSKQLRVLIDDLLDLSKAENEKMIVDYTQFDLARVTEEVASGLRLQAEKKGIKLILQDELPTGMQIVTDRTRYSQILMNIAGNAVKFTSDGEVRIILRAHETPDKIEVAVLDSGIGIGMDHSDHLFQPFAQAEDPMNRRFGGTGLGLALSKKLAHLLGGDLWLQASTLAKGSVFIFTIADRTTSSLTNQSSKESELEAVRKTKVAQFKGIRILAAEDSLDNQSLLSIYLMPTQAELTFAQNGAEAVKLATERQFDLILMDIQMPVMDGFEAVSRLRAAGWKGPILALSAHAHTPEKERALKTGFTEYLTKPISKEKLWESISIYSRHP